MRLIDGKDPATGEQWIQHRDTALTREGKEAAHIPAWDLNMSAPKSFSLAAVVGGDDRLLDAMRAANEKAMRVMEGYVQGRGGGSRPPINTGRWIIATFQHDTSRPVDGYPAPQVHFHNVLMNVQRDFTGQFRALQSAELYKAKSLGTAVFRSNLQRAAAQLGYETRVDPLKHPRSRASVRSIYRRNRYAGKRSWSVSRSLECRAVERLRLPLSPAAKRS